ncbi:1-deoxy-D-xylulose-5-phosphate reductoisomerase [Permianibacter aggregans]|uniref:1-deoxy-D-xylulose 5-phosphate reductoisomerase n=1 Tax=Permianibacter aggregans TaxID=1510150 RepID=A0A4R6UX89_9GAMM|nr:1-deoxy-D-xylulose-5-phosphate reductoisomerase [Permianibacter aggregans]QGX38732.1 1-deoxy-D-xylulose-5-phosphate reductoisomerase [Permianibacter aggregans]TDQ50533.1 1-deoxy-D-xylulose 5-phosphate reductoisomerase [Permianibacter aggregans]
MQNVVILGSTGSIGVSTLDVLARHPERYRVFALVARQRIDRLLEQICTFRPTYVVVTEAEPAETLRNRIRDMRIACEVLTGADALAAVVSAPEVDIVMAAIVGAAGLMPTLAAAKAGKKILLANKEALVMSGALFLNAVKDGGAQLLPIDSEHNAIFQCWSANAIGQAPSVAGVEKIQLTASGGPFLRKPLSELNEVTPDQACSHPTWNMGRKISVDSATLMNKGLEVIEACHLFGASAEQVDVVIHPQSIVHSMVRYLDGSVLAQMGNPDMRTPIAHALAWPERIQSGVAPLDLTQMSALQFEVVDRERFPCLTLAYQALQAGGTAAAVLNAANEVAVDAFLNNRLRFTAISDVIAATLAKVSAPTIGSLAELLAIDAEARLIAATQIQLRAA